MKYLIVILPLFLAACGGGSTDGSPSGSEAPTSSGSELTAAELEHGIGPISAFEPGPLDAAIVETGAETFKIKCSACHKLDERYVGPPLRDVTEKRSPAYIMNMVLNPEEMVQKHPEARALFAQFMTPMPNQQLTEDDARAVLEYLRSAAAESPTSVPE
jgi:mono/diheme cytochrome c family protein